MSMMKALVVAVTLTGGLLATSAATAQLVLPLSYTLTQSGGVVGSGVTTALSTPGTYAYANTGLLPGSATGGLITNSNASFYDAFLVSITDSAGSSISSTIDLTTPGSASPDFQISNFQERLYRYTGTAPIVGNVAGALAFWTTAILLGTNSGTIAALPTTYLGAGTYVLEVRGNVTGAVGGSYSGTVSLSPVPLPATLPLLFGALAVLSRFANRRVA